jgi:hypothetical protein
VSTTRISKRDRRVLVVGAAAVTCILLVGRAVPSLMAFTSEHRRRSDALVARAARTEWLAHNADALNRALERSRGELARHDSALVAGETASAASANLAQVVSDAVAETDARLGAIRADGDSGAAPGEVAHVVAHASITGDLQTIATVLRLLEEGPRMLAVSELSIAATQPNVPHDQVEQLQAELVIDGLYRPSSGKAAR